MSRLRSPVPGATLTSTGTELTVKISSTGAKAGIETCRRRTMAVVIVTSRNVTATASTGAVLPGPRGTNSGRQDTVTQRNAKFMTPPEAGRGSLALPVQSADPQALILAWRASSRGQSLGTCSAPVPIVDMGSTGVETTQDPHPCHSIEGRRPLL